MGSSKQDFFRDLKKEILEIKDTHTNLLDDEAFIVWFLRAFVTDRESEAVDALTGKSGDKSSDAIYVDHDTRIVFIVQGKYHARETVNEPRAPIIALAALGRALGNEAVAPFKALQNKTNSLVYKKFQEVRNLVLKRGYQIALRFVSTGRISDTHTADAEALVDSMDNVRFESYAHTDLMNLMRDYIEGAAPPIPTIGLRVQGAEVFKRFDDQTNITSWIFTMAGKEVGSLYREKGIRLFARNIRGYLGNTDINRVMKVTIQDEPEYFWYYNNGVTIVCDEARQIQERGNNIIRVRNAQIINGQQTTRTLAESERTHAEVLVKLIHIPRSTEAKTERYTRIIGEIVSATNWQNSISQSDLLSNDAEQVRIEREFRKLNYFYIRKRMAKREVVNYSSKRVAHKITKIELARAVTACQLDPYYVRIGKDFLFEEKVYKKIFNGKKATEYLTMYWLFRNVNSLARGDDRKVRAKWHIIHLLWHLMKRDLSKISNREQFRRIAERPRIYGSELEPFYKSIKYCFELGIAFYRLNKKAEGKVQEARDFFKHADLHGQMIEFYEKSGQKRKRLDKNLKKFIQNLDLLAS